MDTLQGKPREEYFLVVLFMTLYKVFLTFESVYEILKCDHSNESYWALLSCAVLFITLYKVILIINFESGASQVN